MCVCVCVCVCVFLLVRFLAHVCTVFDGSAATVRRRGIEEAQSFAMFLKLKMDRKVE